LGCPARARLFVYLVITQDDGIGGEVADNLTVQIDDLRQENLRLAPFDVPPPHVQHLAVAEV
jgi:hypothetical protein